MLHYIHPEPLDQKQYNKQDMGMNNKSSLYRKKLNQQDLSCMFNFSFFSSIVAAFHILVAVLPFVLSVCI